MQLTLGGIPGIKKPTAQEAQAANTHRESLLHSMGGRIESSFKGSKPHIGPLSPGCSFCGQGMWSCMFLNSICNAGCFFCPGGMNNPKAPAYAEQIVFSSPEEYAGYIQKLGFKGVSFSGGEPFLTPDRLYRHIETVRNQLGREVYIWVYTNGLVTSREMLKNAVDAGLDEVRYNIVATHYSLDRLTLATGIVPRVTVEIPAIPEDQQRLESLLTEMPEVGVDHLNLHQLMLTGQNGLALLERGYTFQEAATPPVIESEICALEVMAFALEHGIDLNINYCSLCFKDRWQNRTLDLRAAPLVMRPYETQCETGLVRRLSCQGPVDELEAAIESLRRHDVDETLWEAVDSEGALYFHPALVAQIDVEHHPVHANYYKTVTGNREEVHWARQLRDYHDLQVSPAKTIGIRLFPAGPPIAFPGGDVERLYSPEPPEPFRFFEKIAVGLPEYVG